MELSFKDTVAGHEQDYLCALLMSLSIMSNCYERRRGSNGVSGYNLYLGDEIPSSNGDKNSSTLTWVLRT